VLWWNRTRPPVTAIVVGTVMTPLLAWIAFDTGPVWLVLLAALCPLLVVYGIWALRRLGTPPKTTDSFTLR
jgi:hypothetical protein